MEIKFVTHEKERSEILAEITKLADALMWHTARCHSATHKIKKKLAKLYKQLEDMAT